MFVFSRYETGPFVSFISTAIIQDFSLQTEQITECNGIFNLIYLSYQIFYIMISDPVMNKTVSCKKCKANQ